MASCPSSDTMLNLYTNSPGQVFLDFFQKYEYKTIPGSSLLDPSVPMAFVMSAGLVQVESSAKRHDYEMGSKYALIQNCFRYFDMNLVGNSDVHLSLFQMPGAFTFGPIDKIDIISKIGILLTDVYKIPVKRLWSTYFSGDRIAGCDFSEDIDSRRAWLETGISHDRIIGLKGENNFWKQSATMVGMQHAPKCGPNTELFFDRGEHLACGKKCLPGLCDCGRFVELVNILFIMYNIDEEMQTVEFLGSPFSEAVIGKERLEMVLEDVPSVYETTCIKPLVNHIQSFVRADKLHHRQANLHIRIIADHFRALLFLTADGAPPPGKGGRARLMRKLTRVLLSSITILDISEPFFLHSLSDLCVKTSPYFNNNLNKAKSILFLYIEEEQDRFNATLKKGFKKLDWLISNRSDAYISGAEIVDIEKNIGIPIALLRENLDKKEINYSHRSYQEAYEVWKEAILT
jgi:alanyl-tRNA synthetase